MLTTHLLSESTRLAAPAGGGFLGLIVLLILAAPPPARADDQPAPPNILILLADDLGYGDLGRFGNPEVKTPNLDRLARQGLRLTSCYAAGANCSPSRAGLLTGRTPTRLGIHNWIDMLSPMHLRASEITVATLLQRAGPPPARAWTSWRPGRARSTMRCARRARPGPPGPGPAPSSRASSGRRTGRESKK